MNQKSHFSLQDVVVGLSKLPLLDVTAKAKVDGALSVWLTALDKTSPGIAAKVGKGSVREIYR